MIPRHILYLAALYVALDRLVEAVSNVARALAGKPLTRTEYQLRKI